MRTLLSSPVQRSFLLLSWSPLFSSSPMVTPHPSARSGPPSSHLLTSEAPQKAMGDRPIWTAPLIDGPMQLALDGRTEMIKGPNLRLDPGQGAAVPIGEEDADPKIWRSVDGIRWSVRAIDPLVHPRFKINVMPVEINYLYD